MQYEQGSEKVNIVGAHNTLIAKPLPMNQDPEVQRTRRIFLIVLGVCLALCLMNAINAIFGHNSQHHIKQTQRGVQVGQSLISIAFYTFGIIATYRYSQIGLRVFAWLGIISLIILGIATAVFLIFGITAITAGSVTDDNMSKSLMIAGTRSNCVHICRLISSPSIIELIIFAQPLFVAGSYVNVRPV
ncbi:unnamed protein product [Rotaria sordida]|uniref:Uncharacterized protein n=1 Tax=Rotaria sordida TaxID=392033 RepID=A0A813XNB1_9BILA|nr:unnamed protein product [Rotaria sordida]CAF0895425.1 unnamed protein product [Rotaria sordida]